MKGSYVRKFVGFCKLSYKIREECKTFVGVVYHESYISGYVFANIAFYFAFIPVIDLYCSFTVA